MTTIGFLHPGQMGVTLAANADAKTLWAGAGRSPATAERANAAAMTDIGDVGSLCEAAEIVVSICPPAAAIAVAEEVRSTGFEGVYVDANAISPATSTTIGAMFDDYVDGGVIGPPALKPGTTRMYLAGDRAEQLTSLWSGSSLDVRAMPPSAGVAGASTLKMAYAGWTKGSTALLLTINALAESAGVLDVLRTEWELSQPGVTERSQRTAGAVGRKAWRFSGEMAEIAATMAAADLPSGFHEGAEDLYIRLASFKDGPEPTLDDVLGAIIGR